MQTDLEVDFNTKWNHLLIRDYEKMLMPEANKL